MEGDQQAWTGRLTSPELALRLQALRVVSRQGSTGAASLLADFTPRAGEVYPWVWALSRCAQPEQLTPPRYPASPLHLARFLVRRRLQPSPRAVRRSREECLEALVEALHPLQTLACAVRLMELHGDRAIPPLLDLLRHAPGGLSARLWEEKAECAAWALGQRGRAAVSEIVQVYPDSSARVRPHLAMALWYMGELAVRAIPVLLADPSPPATAALLAMEGASALTLARARRGPIWPDPAALPELAGMAFSIDPEERGFAMESLVAFGESAAPLWEQLARDRSVPVRRQAAQALGKGGREHLPWLLELARDEDPKVAWISRHGLDQADRNHLLHWLRHGNEAARVGAARQLSQVGLPPLEESELNELLLSAQGPVLTDLLEGLGEWGRLGARTALLEILDRADEGAEARVAALKALTPWSSGDEEITSRVLDLLHDPVLGVAAAQALAAVLPSQPADERFTSRLLDLLSHADLRLRREALRTLVALRVATPPVVKALVEALQDAQMAIESAQALVALGSTATYWQLLGSEWPEVRRQAYQAVKKLPDLPPELLEAFRQGGLHTDETFLLLQEKLSPSQLARLLQEAFPQLPDRLGILLILLDLGRPGLEALEGLLTHPQEEVRGRALAMLELMLANPAESEQEWLAQCSLPLREPNQTLQERAHMLLANFLRRHHLAGPPCFRGLAERLCRSPHSAAAAEVGSALILAWSSGQWPEALGLVQETLGHPEPAVRSRILTRLNLLLTAERPPEECDRIAGLLMELEPDRDSEVELRRLFLLGRLKALGPRQFRQTVHFLARHPHRFLEAETLVGTTSSFPKLARLLGDEDPAVSAEAARLLVSRPFQPDRAGRKALEEALHDPAAAAHHPALLKRWPWLAGLAP